MDDGLDAVLADQTNDELLVAGIADDERHALGEQPGESGREVVEHHDALAGIDEFVHHMAADIAGSAGDQDRHARNPFACVLAIR